MKTITGQNEVERVLLDYVQTLEDVDFRFNYELIDHEQDDKGVICELKDLTTNKTTEMRWDICWPVTVGAHKSVKNWVLG